jgi:hypothetical protein
LNYYYYYYMLGGSLSPQHGASSGCGWWHCLQLWKVAANILNKQLHTNDKGMVLKLGGWAWGQQLHPKKLHGYTVCFLVQMLGNMTINKSYITLVHVRVQLQAFYQTTVSEARATPAAFTVDYYD